jgi:hypothetical protein
MHAIVDRETLLNTRAPGPVAAILFVFQSKNCSRVSARGPEQRLKGRFHVEFRSVMKEAIDLPQRSSG